MYGHGFLSFGDSGRRFAQARISQAQPGIQPRLLKRTRRYLLELTLEILRRVLVSGARRSDIAGALLTQTEKKFFGVARVVVGLGSQRSREYLYGHSITALEQGADSTQERRIDLRICEQQCFRRL